MGHQAIQTNDPLYPIREKQWVIRPTHAAYLDWSVDRQPGPPVQSRLPSSRSALNWSAHTAHSP